MRRIALILTILPVLAIWSISLNAKTIYVSKAGSNTSPYDTWAKAATHINGLSIAAGDTVLIGQGVYLNTRIPLASGSLASNKTYYLDSAYVANGSDEFGLAQLNGADTIPKANWAVYSGSGGTAVYRALWTTFSDCDNWSEYGWERTWTVTQDGQLFEPVDAIAGVNAEGLMTHDTTTNYIYIRPFGGVNPNTTEIQASCKTPCSFTDEAEQNLVFGGLDIRMGKQGVIRMEPDGGAPDSNLFRYCKITRNAHYETNNPATIFFDGGGTEGGFDSSGAWDANYARFWSFDNCSIGVSSAVQGGTIAHNGSGCIIYNGSNIDFDSCHFYDCNGDGIEIKNSYSNIADDGIGAQITVRYSTFRDILGGGFNIYSMGHRDSAYGNIFVNCDNAGIIIGDGQPYLADQGEHFLCNNTFYQCNEGLQVQPDNENNPVSYPDFTGQFKYNIIYDIVTGVYQPAPYDFRDPITGINIDIDSNQIYEPSNSPVFWSYWGGTSRTWSYWTATAGNDVNSANTSPGLNTTTFEPSSTISMSQTYGGRTWTVYGAIQPDEECPDTLVAPVFESPANGATGQQNSVILDWSDSTQVGTVTAYDLQVDNNSDYSSVTFSSSPTDSRDTVLVALQYSTTYYWRVRSRTACDTSAWSASRTFVMRAWPLYQDTCLQITEKVNLNMGDTCYCIDSIAYTFAQRDTLIHTNGYDNIRIWGVGTGRRGLIGYSLSDTGSNSTVTDQQTGSVAIHVAGSDNVLIKNLAIVPRTIDDSVRSFVAVNALTVVGINLDNDSIVAGGFSSRAYQQSTTSGGRSFNQLLQNSYFGTVSKGYHRRDALYGATIKLVTSVIQSDRYGGTYQYAYKARNNRIHTIHTGIGSAGLTVDTSPTPDDTLYPLIFIDSNTITLDTRNDLFMTYDDNDVNNSAGDPYGIGVDGVDKGSRIMGNSISSMASTYYGGDGMLLQHIDATIDSPFVVAYNTMSLQHGAHPRIAEGRQAVVGAYVRNYDANLFVKGLWIHHNSGYLVVDEDAGTTYAGRYGEAIRAGFENGANGNRIENNHFSIVPRDSLTRTGAGALEVSGLTFEQHDSSNSVLDHGTGNNIARYNYWRVPRNPIWLGGTRIGIGADNVQIIGDTCNTIYDGDSTFVRFHQSGTYYSHSINNTLQDMVLQGYANVSDVVKGTVTASADAYGKQLHYLRSVTANLKDSSGANVNGGTMWVLNAYGHRFDMPNSNVSGNSSDTLQWRFFGYDALPADGYVVADSNAFNNFTFWGKAGSDSISTTATINWTTSQSISLQLTGIFPLPSPMNILRGINLKGVTIK